MTKVSRPKRKNWVVKQQVMKKKEKRLRKTCKSCGRIYHPLPDNDSETCLICQHNLYFEVLENGTVKQIPRPKSKAKPSTVTKGPRPCKGCKELFDSEGPHNRYCEKCRQSRKNVSPFAEPYSIGNLSRTK